MTVYEKIVQALSEGEENALRLEDMCTITELPERETRLFIEELRRRGAVICSSSSGYFYPADVSELRRYVKKEQARSRSISETIGAAVKLLEEWEAVR